MVHQVEIFGQTYSLRTDADAEHVRRVADLVDQKMREAAGASRSVSTLQIAVLAAMDLASELLHAEVTSSDWAAEVEERSDSMARLIDNLIPAVAEQGNGFPCCVRDSAGSC